MQDHDDFAFEPVKGLPEKLPAGEAMLWQGSPQWRSLARSAFHVRKVAAYFAIVLAWQFASDYRAGETVAAMAASAAGLAGVAIAAIGILCLLAWLYARATIYTLTSRRIVIRSGIALPVTLNLPLSLIETASVARAADGTGSIALAVTRPNRVAWLVLWPNVRPWHFNHPQPSLRCLQDADAVASTLAKALEVQSGVAPLRIPARAGATAGEAGVHVGAGATIAA